MGAAVFTCVLGTAAVLCIIFERQLTVFEAFIAARCRRSGRHRQKKCSEGLGTPDGAEKNINRRS